MTGNTLEPVQFVTSGRFSPFIACMNISFIIKVKIPTIIFLVDLTPELASDTMNSSRPRYLR